MARIPGIQIEKDKKGNPAYARINLKKHGEFIKPLEQIGAIDEDEFERHWNESMSLSEFKNRAINLLNKRIDEHTV